MIGCNHWDITHMNGSGKMDDATRCVHTALDPEPTTGAVHIPIFQTSTYVQNDFADHKGFEYARGDNPTRNTLQSAIANLESPHQEAYAYCFGSGMAAITTITQMLQSGDHIIACDDLYGGTIRLFNQVLSRYNIGVTYTDFVSRDFSSCLQENTKLLWLETPTNPLLSVHDIEELAKQAKSKGIIVVVDSTFATPIIQRPLDLGADMVVHSTTKYIGGHSDVIGGCVVTNNVELSEQLRFLQNATGGVPGPFDCFLTLRGLRTLELRMKRHCENAEHIASHLQNHPKVTNIFYPGLETHKSHSVAKKQMNYFGGMISLELEGGESAARKFAKNLKLFATAESLGGIESLINHPWTMTHASVPEDQRIQAGLSPGLVRLSVGIESKQDLLDDINHSLEKVFPK